MSPEAALVANAGVPDHVPPHLVGTFNLYTSPGMVPTPMGDPQAATSLLRARMIGFYRGDVHSVLGKQLTEDAHSRVRVDDARWAAVANNAPAPVPPESFPQ